MKRLFVSESLQGPVVNWTMLLADLGLALVLVALALLLIWRLYDLFRSKGRWAQELDEPDLGVTPTSPTDRDSQAKEE